MPIPEATEVDQDTYQSMPPPPPPRGTRDYRKHILTIAATLTADAYQDASGDLILHTGWRGALDIAIEILHLVGISAPDHHVDAFGTVQLRGGYVSLDEEQCMAQAVKMAPGLYPELPPHEALRKTLEAGERVWRLPEKLLGVWEEAATALRRDGYADGYTAARVALTRWLNDNYRDDRVTMAAAAASVTHSVWRGVLPPGDKWVEDVLADAPDLSGSLAWAASAEPAHVENMAPGVFGEMLETGRQVSRRRKRSKRCQCCGRKRST